MFVAETRGLLSLLLDRINASRFQYATSDKPLALEHTQTHGIAWFALHIYLARTEVFAKGLRGLYIGKAERDLHIV